MTGQLVDEAEIVVVGAGPAGSACARRLASAGHDVLLTDQSSFPRDKPCGDGLSRSAVAELAELGLDELIAARAPIEGLRFASWSGASDYRGYGARTTARCIPRALVDARLRESALQAGARFRRARVDRVEPDERHPSVVLADRSGGAQPTIRAKLVVAADGATSRLARGLGWGRRADAPVAYGVRAYFRSERELDPVFDIYGPLKLDDRHCPGYGWVFPIEPRVANVGVGLWRLPGAREPMRIREVLAGFVRQLRLRVAARFGDLEIQSPPIGSPLALQFDANRCESDGVLLVGDAARTTDPVSGEGIAYALAGARTVAEIAMRRRRGVASGRPVGQAFARQFPCLLQDIALPLRLAERRRDRRAGNARRAREHPFGRTVRGLLTTLDLIQPLAGTATGGCMSAQGAGDWLAAVDDCLMGTVATSFPLASQLLATKLRFGAGPAMSSALWSVAEPLGDDGASLDCAAALELIRAGASLARDTIDRPVGHGGRANNAMCLLIGDFAFARAIRHAAKVGPEFTSAVGSAIQRACDALFAETVTYFQPSRAIGDIVRATLSQTSLLLRLAVEAGARSAAAGPEALSRYRLYADELGIAIRLAEDLALLLVGDRATGQPPGAGLAIGAYPAAVLWSAAHDHRVRHMVYDEPPADVARLIERIVECGGVEHSLAQVRAYAANAKRALAAHDPPALRELAGSVVDYARQAVESIG